MKRAIITDEEPSDPEVVKELNENAERAKRSAIKYIQESKGSFAVILCAGDAVEMTIHIGGPTTEIARLIVASKMVEDHIYKDAHHYGIPEDIVTALKKLADNLEVRKVTNVTEDH